MLLDQKSEEKGTTREQELLKELETLEEEPNTELGVEEEMSLTQSETFSFSPYINDLE